MQYARSTGLRRARSSQLLPVAERPSPLEPVGRRRPAARSGRRTLAGWIFFTLLFIVAVVVLVGHAARPRLSTSQPSRGSGAGVTAGVDVVADGQGGLVGVDGAGGKEARSGGESHARARDVVSRDRIASAVLGGGGGTRDGDPLDLRSAGGLDVTLKGLTTEEGVRIGDAGDEELESPPWAKDASQTSLGNGAGGVGGQLDGDDAHAKLAVDARVMAEKGAGSDASGGSKSADQLGSDREGGQLGAAGLLGGGGDRSGGAAADMSVDGAGGLAMRGSSQGSDAAVTRHTIREVPGSRISLYDPPLRLSDAAGHSFETSVYHGRVLLVVNVASQCGYTEQNYRGLSRLWERYKSYGLDILAFPCNQFGEQEPGTAAEAQALAASKYGATFPFAAKAKVAGLGDDREDLFRWLTEVTPTKSGDKGQAVSWNFNKFLIDKWGHPVLRYTSSLDYNTLEHDVYDQLVREA